MNIFNQTQLKTVKLPFAHVRMVHAIIQTNAAFIRYKSQAHKSLNGKLQLAKDRTQKHQFALIKVTAEECKLFRDYNDHYCTILSTNMQAFEREYGIADQNGVETYILATETYLLFSSVK
ncbi:hypothetical protein SAMN05216327_101228 [Dyadobacter sp. SG02]|uniref:hypothetical protein n=1 Tax=Dyadobacter sp. SG02 TaxID=1855291 RepID=UPI0008AC607B|nr:hypothetical protein [Dyadobacter sp. SG02]SEI39792.1 hypothetical protein SAMN05216327_101228 [Dyadobacter sp. SG02]